MVFHTPCHCVSIRNFYVIFFCYGKLDNFCMFQCCWGEQNERERRKNKINNNKNFHYVFKAVCSVELFIIIFLSLSLFALLFLHEIIFLEPRTLFFLFTRNRLRKIIFLSFFYCAIIIAICARRERKRERDVCLIIIRLEWEAKEWVRDGHWIVRVLCSKIRMSWRQFAYEKDFLLSCLFIRALWKPEMSLRLGGFRLSQIFPKMYDLLISVELFIDMWENKFLTSTHEPVK